MSRKIFSKKDALLPLSGPPQLGESYHVCWAGNGVMGICTRVFPASKQVELKRPKQRTAFKNLVYWGDLRHTRIQQLRIESGQSPYPDRTHDVQHHKRLKKFKRALP